MVPLESYFHCFADCQGFTPIEECAPDIVLSHVCILIPLEVKVLAIGLKSVLVTPILLRFSLSDLPFDLIKLSR